MTATQIAASIMSAALEFMANKSGATVAEIMQTIEASPNGAAAARYEELCRLGLAKVFAA
jgi:hypothetical protein